VPTPTRAAQFVGALEDRKIDMMTELTGPAGPYRVFPRFVPQDSPLGNIRSMINKLSSAEAGKYLLVNMYSILPGQFNQFAT
jgi:hypothetical protein